MKSMSFMKTGRLLQASLLLVTAFALTACGFHLRENASLPASMKRVHLTVSGEGAFERHLARSLEVSGVTVVDESGPDIAELRVPTVRFSSESLTAGGYVRITEAAVRFHVEFDVIDSSGQVLVPSQRIDMSREYSYDAADAIGNGAQVEALQKSLSDDMVQAILFRLQAAGKQQLAEPAAAPSTR
jgi:LPS-assembly lipoprotein